MQFKFTIEAHVIEDIHSVTSIVSAAEDVISSPKAVEIVTEAKTICETEGISIQALMEFMFYRIRCTISNRKRSKKLA